jgi:UDP-glucose 4-epimerase
MASSFNLFRWLPTLWATFFDRMQKVIWITGCRGFIGRHLAAWLSGRGHIVVGIGHGPWPTAEAQAWGVRRWLNGGIHASNLQQLLRDAGPPEYIFHLAGGSSVGASIDNPYEDFTRTVATTAELLEWMRLAASNARLISVSSAAVYGAGHTGPIREEQALLPSSPYGYHKLMMENVCRSYAANYGLTITVVRLFSVYGSWLKKQVLWDMCTCLASGTRQLVLGGTGEELRDWTDIRDVVRALEFTMGLATDPETLAIFNIGSGQGTSVSSIAAMVLESWPAPARVVFSGEARPGNPCSLVADGWYLRKNGFAWSVPVKSGVHDYVRWYLQSSRGDV